MERESSVWSFFTKKAEFIATCNTCSQNYSYRAGTSNLRKHWYNKHGKLLEGKPSDLSENTSDNSDEEQDKAVAAIVKNTKSMVTWKYFEPLDLEKCEATCKICSRTLSFKYMSDLKQHVQSHGHEPTDSDDEFVPEVHEKKLKRRYKSRLWEFFRATDDKMAECLMCHNLFNFGSTITNLRRHLMRKHGESALPSQDDEPKSVIEYDGNLYEVVKEDDESLSQDACSLSLYLGATRDDACEELLKVTDVWGYFDTDSGKRAQCTVCHITLGNEYDELKAHLKDNHPKLLLQLLQNKDQDSDAASNGDDDNENTYTEIVYLEHEPTENVKVHKEKPKSFAKPAKKRERLHSLYSSDDIPHKKLKKDEENDELGVFIKYITCLLKKLPADVFSNVQIEIINTILKANSQAANTSRSMVLNTELINTSSNIITVDGITPISNTMTGHNYTITVAPPKETKTENGN